MPFLALDDNLGFKAWRRIYIYCILAAALSLVTFIGSLLMDRSSKTSATGDGENHSTDDNDDKVLEPDTVPEFTLAELMMRNIEMLDRPATLTEPHQPRTFDELDPGDNVPSAGTDAWARSFITFRLFLLSSLWRILQSWSVSWWARLILLRLLVTFLKLSERMHSKRILISLAIRSFNFIY